MAHIGTTSRVDNSKSRRRLSVTLALCAVMLLLLPAGASATPPSTQGTNVVVALSIPIVKGAVVPMVQYVPTGGQATITVKPWPGMMAGKVIDMGKDVTSGLVDNRLTLTNVRSPHAIVVWFKKCPTPILSGLTPKGGPVAGGNQVTITGSNFEWVKKIWFGDKETTDFTVAGPTSITVKAPEHAAGPVDVRVETMTGVSAVVTAGSYLYADVPSITSVAASHGPTAGGTEVTISGTNFLGVSAVTFGDEPATDYSVTDSGTIEATAPAHDCAVVHVCVTCYGGKTAACDADKFTFVDKPSVTQLTPHRGPGTGGREIVVTGDQFVGPLRLWFGLTEVTSFTVNSPTSITVPSSPPGVLKGHVVVENLVGESDETDQNLFTWVQQPAIVSISPSRGPQAGGTTVSIYGLEFIEVESVKFGASDATSFEVVGTNEIRAVSPAGTGTVGIAVKALGGTSTDTLLDNFTYLPSPVVTQISPTSGGTSGGTLVTVTGSNLNHGTEVYFGDTRGTVVLALANSVTALSPAHAAGPVHVTVKTDGGTSTTSDADLYTYVGPPTITSINPTSGTWRGGTWVTITGTGFTGVTGVSFGVVPSGSYSVLSDTQISARSPGGVLTVHIRVFTNHGTTTDSDADKFKYQ